MKAIYSSKLYKASTHKALIRAAVDSPINVELVKQLREYLDDEYLTPEYVDTSDVDNSEIPEDAESTEKDDNESIRPSESHGGGGGGTPSGPSLDTHMSDKLAEEEGSSSPEGPAPSEESPSEEPVGESTKVSGHQINSSVSMPRMSIVESLGAQLDVIKGLLNSREDTQGVVRLALKDDELWIYYNDKMNLNTVMEPVIQVLNASGHTYLDFNRLARTENAIVFEVLKYIPAVQPMVSESNE